MQQICVILPLHHYFTMSPHSCKGCLKDRIRMGEHSKKTSAKNTPNGVVNGVGENPCELFILFFIVGNICCQRFFIVPKISGACAQSLVLLNYWTSYFSNCELCKSMMMLRKELIVSLCFLFYLSCYRPFLSFVRIFFWWRLWNVV